jgi:uncharacterized protein (TIGR03437 family)
MKLLLWILLPASLFGGAATINYTYDAAGRLTKVDYGNGTSVSYTYDNAGNLTSRQVGGSGPTISSVTTAYGSATISQNDFIVIKGSNLVPATTPAAGAIWSTAPSFANGQMPTQLNNVSVTVNGKAAFIYFFCSAATDPACSQDQLNVLTPLDNTTGPVQVITTSPTGTSSAFTVTMAQVSPAFLLFSGSSYAVATHTNNALLAPTTLYPGLSTPAAPGEDANLYMVGFALPTTALVNGSSTQSGVLPTLPVCQIGGNPAPVNVADLISPGLYVIDVTVPANAANGDNPISCTYGGASTLAGGLITVQQ